MTARDYARISAPFRGEGREKALNVANRLVTRLCYVLYPVLLIVLAVQRDARTLRALLVPAVSFALVTVVRNRINEKRPYETLDIVPIIRKNTSGKSMPSRHTFSVFAIAVTFLWVLPWSGILLLCLGVLLAAVRVIGGVHYPRDVIAGGLAGIACGVIGYWMIP